MKNNKSLIFVIMVLALLLLAVVLIRVDESSTVTEEAVAPPTVNASGIKTYEVACTEILEEEDADTESAEEPDTASTEQVYKEQRSSTAVALTETSYNSDRYASIIPYITAADIDLVAAAVYQEANNQSFEGQQAVAEVIFNRMLNTAFPNTAYEVLYQSAYGYWQFSTAPLLASTTPNQTNYDAVMAALYGPQVLDSTDVVFFSRSPENSRVADHIGAHWFCREYIW